MGLTMLVIAPNPNVVLVLTAVLVLAIVVYGAYFIGEDKETTGKVIFLSAIGLLGLLLVNLLMNWGFDATYGEFFRKMNLR